LSKKKSKAGEKKDEEDKSDNRLLNLFLMLVIGPAIIASSVVTRYYVGGLVGFALILWGVWETPEIHPYLKLVINWKSRKQQVDVKESPGSKVVSVQGDVGRDVNIFQVSPENEPAQQVPNPVPSGVTYEIAPYPTIDDTPILEPKSATTYPLRLSKDDSLTIEVNADQPVSVELLTMLEWENKSENRKYDAERYRDSVRNAKIDYKPRRGGEYVLWVYNENRIRQQVGVRVTKF